MSKTLFRWIFISILINPILSYANDPICNARSSSLYDVVVGTCEATLEALDCKNIVPEDQIRDCNRSPSSSPYTTSRYLSSQTADGPNPLAVKNDEEIFKACAIGFGTSAKEFWDTWVVDNVSALVEFVSSPSLPSLPSIESIGESISSTWNFTRMTTSYLWTEYQRARGQTGGMGTPIDVGVMTTNIATPVIIKVKETIEEEVTHLQCLKEEIQANMICNFLADISIPPGGFVAFLKVGKLASRTYPSVERAFARLKGILPAAINEEKLLRFMRKDDRGSSSFQRELTLASERYGHVIRNSNEAVLFHGSGSASLLTFTSNKPLGGLRPTGELLRQGKAPFTGELNTGTFGNDVGQGINSDSLSAVKITDLNLSLNYLGKLGERTQSNRFSFQRGEMEKRKKALKDAQKRGDSFVTKYYITWNTDR